MQFRTEYTTRRLQGFLDPSRRVVMLGSCFTDNIGTRILDSRWPATVNPCGTLFNPLSIARVLELACKDIDERREALEKRLFEYDGLWRSWDLSTLFAASTRTDCMAKCMQAVADLRSGLEEADALIVTLGTAWIYRLEESGEPVANCHKMPERIFRRHLETPETLSRAVADSINKARTIAPDGLKVIFTVSPVRHLRDGMAGNSLSKAILRMTVAALTSSADETVPSSDYFPAYEILMDDLRDYRFYADDLLHPSPAAIRYIWEAFQNDYLTPEDREIIREGEALTRRAAHRPLM